MALRGTFSETEPQDLLQILALGGKTGVLTVSDQGRVTKVVFLDGEIIDAFDGAQRGEEAVFALLASRSGSFVFASEIVSGERTIHRNVPTLLLVAARRMDDLAHARDLLGRPTARVRRLREVGAQESAGLDDAQRRLLELANGRCSVGEIVAASDLEVDTAYRALAALVEQEWVSLIAAEEEGSAFLSEIEEPVAVGVAGPGPVAAGNRRPTGAELQEIVTHLRQAARASAERSG